MGENDDREICRICGSAAVGGEVWVCRTCVEKLARLGASDLRRLLRDVWCLSEDLIEQALHWPTPAPRIAVPGFDGFNAAVSELRARVVDDPNDVHSWLKLGDVYVKQGDVENAVDTYRTAAGIYEARDFALKACAVHKQMLRVDPLNIETRVRAAELLLELDLVPESVVEAIIAIRLARGASLQRALRILASTLDAAACKKLGTALRART